jgi:hypothetical protein
MKTLGEEDDNTTTTHTQSEGKPDTFYSFENITINKSRTVFFSLKKKIGSKDRKEMKITNSKGGGEERENDNNNKW